jgi:hypothetical protein
MPCPPNLPPTALCANRTVNAGPTCTVSGVSIDNGTFDPDNGPGPLIIDESPGNTYAYPLGNTTATLTASDTVLTSTCSAIVTVKDNAAPTITCPDQDPSTPGNQYFLECVNGGAVGTFTATATDNCGGTPTVTCNPNGVLLPMGSTTNVTCTAKDAAGNQSSCTLQAIVRDTQPPVTGSSKGMTLWPADGLLHEISLMDCANFAVDACSGRLNPLKDWGVITYVTSDEQDDAQGGSDGNTTGDIQVKKQWLALVRAERDTQKDGRVYTIHYVAKDNYGNIAPGTCKVGVPKNANNPAVDSGAQNGFCFDSALDFPNVNNCP